MTSSAPDAGRDSDVGRQILVVTNAAVPDITEREIEVRNGDELPLEWMENQRVATMSAHRETAKSWGMEFADDGAQRFFSRNPSGEAMIGLRSGCDP